MSQDSTSQDQDSGNNITALRAELFATLRGLRKGSMTVEQARAVSDVAQTIINTAKVEVDYIRANNGGESEFLDGALGKSNLPPGITGHRVHRLK